MSDPTKGGRGKAALYKTEMYRIPTALKPTIMTLGTQFKRLYGGLVDPTGEKLISRIEAAIPDLDQIGANGSKNMISSNEAEGIADIKYQELEAELVALEQEKQQLQSTLVEVFEAERMSEK
jgi:hypothetical protein